MRADAAAGGGGGGFGGCGLAGAFVEDLGWGGLRGVGDYLVGEGGVDVGGSRGVGVLLSGGVVGEGGWRGGDIGVEGLFKVVLDLRRVLYWGL